MNWFIQGLGLGAFILNILTFQFAKREKIILTKLGANSFFVVHYILLGGFVGAGMNFLAGVKNLVFLGKDKFKWAAHPLCLWVFLFLYWAIGLMLWKGWWSVLPILGNTVGIFSFWCMKPKYIRLWFLPAHVFWFIYDMIVGSYTGMMTDVLIVSSVMVGIIRFDILKQEEKKL